MIPPNQNGFSRAPRVHFGPGPQTPQFPQRIENPSGGEPLPVDLLVIENNRNLQLETQPPNIHVYNMAGGTVNMNLIESSAGWPQSQQPQQHNVNMVQPQRQQNHRRMIMPRPFSPYPRPSLGQQAFNGSTSSSPALSSYNSSDCNCSPFSSSSSLENMVRQSVIGNPTPPLPTFNLQ